MDQVAVELNALLGWLRTFNLSSEVSASAGLSDGLAISEALVQIEPSVFTPVWFAGLLNANGSNYQNLNSVLSVILHYYRHNLGDVCIADDLPVPDIPATCTDLPIQDIVKFLKLMLGVAVTCSNKQTFITKIQSLDETAQHALTSCVASFIYTREWTGRLSQHSATPDLKVATPPGDEIWAQKCHELDFQVAMLKEERASLMSENEELYGKVRAAQTLSRKDSIKTREFEKELAHIRDEFERLRLAYEGTRATLEAMEIRLKTPAQENGGPSLERLAEETATLRSQLGQLRQEVACGRSSSGAGGCGSWRGEGPELEAQLHQHSQDIAEMRAVLEFQAGLSQEVQCLKDQVDVLREQNHRNRNHDQELKEIRERLGELQAGQPQQLFLPDWQEEEAHRLRQLRLHLHHHGLCASEAPPTPTAFGQNRTLMSVESESGLIVSSLERLDGLVKSESVEELETSQSMETVVPTQKSFCLAEGSAADTPTWFQGGVVTNQHESAHSDEEEEDVEEEVEIEMDLTTEKVNIQTDLIEHTIKMESRLVHSVDSGRPSSPPSGGRPSSTASSEDSDTPEVTDSGLEVTTSENTPFASRPESELVLAEDKVEEEVQPTPRQLEMLLEESGNSSPDSGTAVFHPATTGTEAELVDPVLLEPVSAEPVQMDPVSAEPVLADPVSAEPVLTEPLLAEPEIANPVLAELVLTEPAHAEKKLARTELAELELEQLEKEMEQEGGQPLVRRKRTSTETDVEATHRSVDEIICRISDPNLDCSLEDIEAIMEASGPLEVTAPAAVEHQGSNCRVSPEFTQAADMIDKTPDQLFDPEDPAVKELEEWPLHSSDKSLTIELMEEQSPLMEEGEEGAGEERAPQKGRKKKGLTWGCVNSWLLRIFIKIFD